MARLLPTRRIGRPLQDVVAPMDDRGRMRLVICTIVLLCNWGGSPLTAQEYGGTLRVTHSPTHRGLLSVDARGASLGLAADIEPGLVRVKGEH